VRQHAARHPELRYTIDMSLCETSVAGYKYTMESDAGHVQFKRTVGVTRVFAAVANDVAPAPNQMGHCTRLTSLDLTHPTLSTSLHHPLTQEDVRFIKVAVIWLRCSDALSQGLHSHYQYESAGLSPHSRLDGLSSAP
jgi:hypothetical protein